MSLADLPTLAEVDALRRARGFGKGDTRLQDRTAEDRAQEKQDEKFRRDIYRLDKGVCRCCGRKVARKIDRVVDRAEVHHVAPRADRAVRWDVRNGLLVCAFDHERITGRVNDRLQVVGTKWFKVDGKRYIDARQPVKFVKVA